MFQLGTKSLQKLEGVHPALVAVVKQAITITKIDFAVHEGLRTLETQKEYVRAGVSQTMHSRHLTGHAVDLVPYIDGKLRWEWPPIFEIACAMDAAATAQGVQLRWGGVWDMTMMQYGGSPYEIKKAVDDYCKRHPGPDFIDGPHYELPKAMYP